MVISRTYFNSSPCQLFHASVIFMFCNLKLSVHVSVVSVS